MLSILSKLKNLLKADGQQALVTPKEGHAEFLLTYKDLEIGKLWLEQGKWHFAYSEAFKAQDKIKPLVDFSKVEKIYHFESLPPFFLHRIPGMGQPKVRKIIKEDKIDPTNEVELLKRFGKKSISNPFRLNPV